MAKKQNVKPVKNSEEKNIVDILKQTAEKDKQKIITEKDLIFKQLCVDI